MYATEAKVQATRPIAEAGRHSITDSFIVSLMEQTDQLHKQINQLTERLESVLTEDCPKIHAPEDPVMPVACRLHERLGALQERLANVSRHLNTVSERIVL